MENLHFSLEAGGVFGGDGQGTLQSQGGTGKGAFVEEAADQGDAVGDTARRGEFRERGGGVGGPVAAGFGDLDETGAEGERWVSGEVADRQHFVAEGWHQQQVYLREEARHFAGRHAAHAVCLHEVDGGEETRLAEDVGPGV